MRKGWMGEEDIRTQDFLPENMPGFLKGVVGFAGDVLTDPLTFGVVLWVRPSIMWAKGLAGQQKHTHHVSSCQVPTEDKRF
jgi:hypothetical protein